MSAPMGDFDTGVFVYGKFTTYRPSTGAPFTLAGTPVLSVYKDNSTTQSTAGVSLTVDFDSVTGLNHFSIDTSADGTFYSSGSFFDVVITTGTVDSVSAVGTVVGSFTLRKTSALKPTVAGRTLDVSSGGEAGLDWANVGSPTTSVNLSSTQISNAATVTTVNGLASGVITATSIGAGALVAAVWDGLISGHTTSGTFGGALNSASSAGDPWATVLPGVYAAGTAGHIVGTAIPDVAPGADGGLVKLGANSYTLFTFTATGGAGVKFTGSSANPGFFLQGGAGAPGTRSAGGIAGRGAEFTSQSGADGININSTGTAVQITAATRGIRVDAASGEAALFNAGGNSPGMTIQGGLGGSNGYGLYLVGQSGAADILLGSSSSPSLSSAVMNAAMTESYASNGSPMTPAQSLHMLWSLLGQKDVVSTTLTAKKLNGATASMTFVLNDATNPTAVVRSS